MGKKKVGMVQQGAKTLAVMRFRVELPGIKPAPQFWIEVMTATTPDGLYEVNQGSPANRCHHIPKQRHWVTNSAAYDAALRQRGNLTVWFTDAAIVAWKAEPRTMRGGQLRYSAPAIATALTLRSVFCLALR